MDIVRQVTGIDKIHKGVDLPQAYTGKGVVTGIVDGGIDPNHINFLKPDGTTRFGYLSKDYSNNHHSTRISLPKLLSSCSARHNETT